MNELIPSDYFSAIKRFMWNVRKPKDAKNVISDLDYIHRDNTKKSFFGSDGTKAFILTYDSFFYLDLPNFSVKYEKIKHLKDILSIETFGDNVLKFVSSDTYVLVDDFMLYDTNLYEKYHKLSIIDHSINPDLFGNYLYQDLNVSLKDFEIGINLLYKYQLQKVLGQYIVATITRSISNPISFVAFVRNPIPQK